MAAPLRVINCHDFERGWSWIAPIYDRTPEIEWQSVDTLRPQWLRKVPGPHLGRLRAGLEVRAILARGGADMLVSHGPYTSYYIESVGRGARRDVPHLAFAFNFTDIPQGQRLGAMQRAFRSIERMVVYSQMERSLYSERFGVPIDRFSFMRWVSPRRSPSLVHARSRSPMSPRSEGKHAISRRCARPRGGCRTSRSC